MNFASEAAIPFTPCHAFLPALQQTDRKSLLGQAQGGHRAAVAGTDDDGVEARLARVIGGAVGTARGRGFEAGDQCVHDRGHAGPVPVLGAVVEIEGRVPVGE